MNRGVRIARGRTSIELTSHQRVIVFKALQKLLDKDVVLDLLNSDELNILSNMEQGLSQCRVGGYMISADDFSVDDEFDATEAELEDIINESDLVEVTPVPISEL